MTDIYNNIIQNPTLFLLYVLITIFFLRFLSYRFSTRFLRNDNVYIGTLGFYYQKSLESNFRFIYTGVFVIVTFLFLYLGDSPLLKPAMLAIRPVVFVFIICLFFYRVE